MFCHPVVVANPALSWQGIAQGLRGTNRFLFGFEDAALVLHESQLESHAYIVGDSNSGKTSRVIAPLVEQLVHARKAVWVVDCKADPLLLGHMQEAAKEAGRALHFFSLQPGLPSSFRLDFFAPLVRAGRGPQQITELLIGSLGLNKSAESFFVTQNSNAVRTAIEEAAKRGAISFGAIAHHLRQLLATSDRYQHAGHALDVFESLAACPELNPSSLPAPNFEDLIQRGELCYFCLPVSTESKLTAATTASLLMKLVAALSKDLAIRGKRSERVYIAIDEFQDVASTADLTDLMAQVRGIGGGISMILAHQVPQQVASEGMQALLLSAGIVVLMRPRVLAKTLQEWSGEKTVWKLTDSEGTNSGPNGMSMSRNRSYAEEQRPVLEMNVIQQVNATPGCAIVIVEGGQPFPVYFPHHVEWHVAKDRERRALSRSRETPSVLPRERGKQAPKNNPKNPKPQPGVQVAQAASQPPSVSAARPKAPSPKVTPFVARLVALAERLEKTLLFVGKRP